MKIVLIFPRAVARRGTRVKNYMVPPYGLQLLAALTPPEHEVSLLDEFHRPIDPGLEADLVGISVWTASSGNAYRLADAFRARGIPVVMGGPHVAVVPEEAALHADAVVVGEAESVWPQLLADLEAGQLASLYLGESLPLSESPPPARRLIVKVVVGS